MGETNLSNKLYCVVTYGCQMNKHDSERVSGMLTSLGAKRVETIEESEIVVFLTCCVRDAADVRLKGQVASLKNIPLPEGSTLEKRIVAIGGCIGQRDDEKLVDELPHIDVVFGTFNLSSLPRLIDTAISSGGHCVEVLNAAENFPTDLPSIRDNSWAAWLPISIGCNNFCSYCIVPHVRGREKSRAFEDVVAEAKALVADGVKDITLLGQNVNSYGRDLYGGPRFAELLRAVADTGIARLRFATSHPKDLNEEVIRAFGELDNLMPALHLAVQSGSNSVLKAMNRHYTRQHYLSIVERLREVRPDIALSTDIIVGFPGETEADFEDTYNLVDEVGYQQVFTFLFSPREGTPAAKMHDDTPPEVVQARFERLVELVGKKAYDANQADLGRVVEVLVDGSSKRDVAMLAGKSPKNQTVHAPLPAETTIEDFAGTFVNVEVEEARTWYLRGKLV